MTTQRPASATPSAHKDFFKSVDWRLEYRWRVTHEIPSISTTAPQILPDSHSFASNPGHAVLAMKYNEAENGLVHTICDDGLLRRWSLHESAGQKEYKCALQMDLLADDPAVPATRRKLAGGINAQSGTNFCNTLLVQKDRILCSVNGLIQSRVSEIERLLIVVTTQT